MADEKFRGKRYPEVLRARGAVRTWALRRRSDGARWEAIETELAQQHDTVRRCCLSAPPLASRALVPVKVVEDSVRERSRCSSTGTDGRRPIDCAGAGRCEDAGIATNSGACRTSTAPSFETATPGVPCRPVRRCNMCERDKMLEEESRLRTLKPFLPSSTRQFPARAGSEVVSGWSIRP
jgi:hypothetical protein